MAAFNLKQYVKNVSKSAGYVAAETLKELNPTITQFAETNSDALKEMYSAVRDYKKIIRDGKESIANSEYTKIAKETVSNFMDDLKTGNFYNKERVNKAESEMGFDIDMGDFDFDDWNNIDENWGDSNDDEDTLTFSAMDNIGYKMSTASGKAAMASADYVVKAGRANTKSILGHADVLFGKVNSGLSAINSTIATIGKTSVETANTHYENSTKFYSTATEELAKQTGYLTMIHDLLKERFAPAEKDHDRAKNRYSDVVSYDGVLDMKEYMKAVKENLAESTYVSVATTIMSTMNSFGGGGPAMLRSVLASPISSLMKMGASGAVSSVLGKDFERLNKSLSGAFGTMMVKLNKKSNDFGPKGFLAELFGIKPNQKRTIDTGKYEKGRVDWNGKDEKALREVIPTQLSLILSALTGQEAKIFNYDTGKWTTYKQLQSTFKSEVKNISKRATSDIQTQFEDYFLEDNKSNNMSRSSKAFHTFRQDSQNFFHYLTMNNDRIPTSDKEWDELEHHLKYLGLFADLAGDVHRGVGVGNGIMLYSSFKKIRQYYKRNAQSGKRYLNTITNGQLLSGRNDIAQYYQNQENDPASMYGMLFSGNNKNSPWENDKNMPKIKNHFLNSMVDDKGNNLFYYMQQFFINLERISYNTSLYNGGASGKRKGGQRPNSPGGSGKTFEVPDNNPQIDKTQIGYDRWTEESSQDAAKKYSGVKEEHKDAKQIWLEQREEDLKKFKESSPLMRLGKPGKFLQDLLMLPASHISKVLDKVDENIYELLYGETEDKPGIYAKMRQGFDDTFHSIKESAKKAMNDVFSPLATVFGDKLAGLFGYGSFKDMRAKMKEGILNSDFAQGVKSNLKGAWNWAKSGVKDAVFTTGDYFTNGAFTPGVEKVLGKVKGFRNRGENPQAAHGGMVTKTGMVSVSEGEMIIPSEKNPFYTKPTNKTSQIVKEKYNASRYEALGGDNYWGEYSNGGRTRNKKKGKKGKNNSVIRKGKGVVRQAQVKAEDAKRYAENTIDDIRETAEDTMSDIRNTEGYQKLSNAFDYVANYTKERGIDVIDRLFGSNHDKNGSVIDKDTRRENTKNKLSGAWNEVKSNAKPIAAGGIIGGGVSAITGLVGGPLVGAAVGAATALTINSNKFQEALFGKDILDKDNKKVGREYGTGFFGKRTSEFLEKKFPQMAKFGLAGGLGGLLGVLPGGPVGGMILGSAINFAVQNDSIKNYLFGEEGLFEGGDEKIKRLLPKIAGGAAIGALTGPFGLVGNMLLGGAIGFTTDTNKFKEAIFGIEDSDGNLQGGLLGVMRDQVIDPMKNYFKGGMQKFEDYMKEYIFDPFADLFKPFGNLIGHAVNNAVDFLKGKISDHVVKPMAEKISKFFQPLTNIFGKLGKGAINLAANLFKLPGMGARKLGQQMDYKAVKKGYALNRSAEERYQMQDDFALKGVQYKTRDYDKFAATADYDTLRSNKNAIDLYEKAQNNATLASRDIKQSFYNTISADTGFETSGKESKLLRNAFNKYSDDGNMDHVKNTIDMLTKNGKLSEEQAGKLLDRANDTQSRLQQIKNNDLSKLKEEAESAASNMGFKNLSDIDPKMKRLLMADINDKKKQAESENKDKAKDKKDGEAPLGSVVLDTKDHTLLDSILHPVQEIRDIHNRSVTFLNDIRNGIFKLAGIDIPTDDTVDTEGGRDVSQSAKALSEAAKEEAAVTPDKHPSASDIVSETKAGETVTKVTEDGKVMQFVNDGKGNLEPKVSDAGTKNALKEQEEEKTLRHKFYDSMTGFKGFFSGLFADDEEEKKDKDSILEKIMKLAGLAGIGGSILSVVGTAVAGIGGLVLGHNIENALTGHDPSKYNDTVDEEGNIIPEYERKTISQRYISNGLIKHGLIGGSTGSKILSKIPFVGKPLNAGIRAVGRARNWAATKIIGSKTGQAAAKAASTQVGKVGSKLATTTVGKAVGGFAENIAAGKVMKSMGGKAWDKATQSAFKESYKSFAKSGVTNAAEMAAETVGASAVSGAAKGGIISKLVSLLHSAISKALSLLGVKGGDAIAREGADQLGAAVAREGSEKVAAASVKSMNIALKLGFIALAAQNGWEDAKAILGIIEEPSLKERALAAAISGCNEVILGIIPNEYIFNILFTVLTAAGIVDGKELQQKREDAKAIVADYNATNNETYNVREYIKNVLGEYTTQEKIGKTVGGAVKKVGSVAVKGVKAVGKGITSVGKIAVGSVKAVGKGIAAVGSGAVNFAKSSINLVKKAGGKVIDFAKSAKEAHDALKQLPDDMYKAFGNKDLSIGDVFRTKINISEDNPLKGITETVANVNRFTIMPAIFIKKIGATIKKKAIDPFVDKMKDTGMSVMNNYTNAKTLSDAGDIVGLLSLKSDTGDDESNPIGFVSSATNLVNKISMIVPTSFRWVGNKVNAVFDALSGPISKAGEAVLLSSNNAIKFKDDHDITGLLTMNNSNDIDGPLKFLVGASDIANKFAYAAPTVFGAISDKLTGLFKSAKKALDVKELAEELWSYTDPSSTDMESYDSVVDKYKDANDDSVTGTINSVIATVVGGILKGVVSFIRPIRSVTNWFADKFDWVKDKATDLVESARDSLNEYAGSGSGVHVSQNDPSYANKKFGKSTLGQNGCGPAVAATVLRQYGKHTSIDQTAGYALAKGYVAGASGTRASYFSDVLGRNGIQSQYTNNGNDIRKAVSSGKPTILLGQNNANRSKTNSPFGPNPHYVVAQGTKNGKVVVNDPELGSPALYKSNILKNAKLGIMTGGESKIDQNGVEDAVSSVTAEINRKAAANSGGANKEVVGDDGTITSGNGDYIGKYVKKFESGDKGSDMISSGKGDYGGVSFGSYQFPSYGDSVTKKGNLPLFWNTYFASQYPGVQPGNNDQFKSAWKSAVAKNPADFFNKEHEFVAKQYYDSIASELNKNGVGNPTTYNRAAQEAAWSSAVQYGPVSAANLFKASGISNAMDPSLYVTKLYDHKINTIPTKFKSSSQDVRDSIKNRYSEEQKIILGLAGQKPIDPHSTNGAISGNGVTSSGSTYGNSGTTSNSSSNSFDIGSILDAALGNIFGNVFSKLGKVGEMFSKVFGFTKEDSSVEGSTDPNSSSSAAVGESGGSVSGDKANNFPYFRQADERWGNIPYGKSGTIANSGCGPTSMAMVLQSYGKNVTPKDTAEWSAKNGYRAEGNGTSWGFFNAIGKTEGIETKQFSEVDTAKQLLNSGVPVIGSMRPGDFTKGGHFIVFSGLNGNTLAVNDPANTERTTKRWDANNALGQAKQFWAFTKDNKGSLPATNTSAGAAAQQQSSNNMVGTGSGIIDFTKRTDYSRNDITRIPVSREIGKVTSHMNAIGGDSGTLSTTNQELLKLMVEYLQIIAQNTTANTNIKTIVEILQSIMKIMPDKSSITNAATSAAVQTSAALSNAAGPGNTNTDMKIEAEMKSIMAKLQQLARAV